MAQSMRIKRKSEMFAAAKLAVILMVTVFSSVISSTCAQEQPIFGDRVNLGLIEYDAINEASGLAASRKNTEVLWTHNDSGDIARIFAFNTKGKHLGIFKISGALARDWEDIAVGPGPVDGEQYLYIGEIGDNSARYDLKYIYRIIEPVISHNRAPIDTTITITEKITFRFPDGNRDAETLMVDPLTRDIYVVSKRERSVRVYCLPYPQPTAETVIPEHVVTLDLTNTNGGDISPSGREILIKTNNKVYYWHRNPTQDLNHAFDTDPLELPYIPEPQGEAVSWKPDSMGYYTISEEKQGRPSYLYFYPRIGVEDGD